jgi:hypothetical protein
VSTLRSSSGLRVRATVLVLLTIGLAVVGACTDNDPFIPTCDNDQACPAKQVCENPGSKGRCVCSKGLRGAECGTHSDCAADATCNLAACVCVQPEAGVPPLEDSGSQTDSGSTETPDAEAGAPTKKACTTKEECVRACDCDGDGTMECSYTFACEDGYCYEAPPEGGYSYMTCERICTIHC